MSTTVTYKGSTLTTADNNTKTLKTAGKYLEDDITLVDVSSAAPTLQTKTNIDPTTSSQTITADSGYDGLDRVQINAMPAMTLPTSTAASATSGYTLKATATRNTADRYINIPTGYNASGAYYKVEAVPNGTATAPASITGTGATVTIPNTSTLTFTKTISVTPSVTTAGYISSGTAGNSEISLSASINARSSSDLSAVGATVSGPSGFYASSLSKSVASGTAGTPTATKGTVSNHSISVTPSVTNTTGYITGSTITGTAVTVSASELVSGSETKTQNGTYDVTNLASLVVNVSGSSPWTIIGTGSFNVSTTSTSASSVGTISCGSALLTSDDIIWVHIRGSRGKSAGYYYGSDTYFLNTYPANNISGSYSINSPAIITIRCTSNGNYEIYSGQYGVYANSLSSDGTISIRRRYNSTYTLTINDTFSCTVYRLRFAGNAKMLE